MSKTAAGFLLVGGILLAIVSATFAGLAANTLASPSDDWFYDLIKYSGIAGLLIGVGMFFYGAMVFSRKQN